MKRCLAIVVVSIVCCAVVATASPAELFEDVVQPKSKGAATKSSGRDNIVTDAPRDAVPGRSRLANMNVKLLQTRPEAVALNLLPGARFVAKRMSSAATKVLSRNVWVGRLQGYGPGEGVVVFVTSANGSTYGVAEYLDPDTNTTRHITVVSSPDRAAKGGAVRGSSRHLIYETSMSKLPRMFATPPKAKEVPVGPPTRGTSTSKAATAQLATPTLRSTATATAAKAAGSDSGNNDTAAEGRRRMLTLGGAGEAELQHTRRLQQSQSTQDLLVVYSQGAVRQLGSAQAVQDRIVAAVALANQAYRDSGIPLTVRLVRMAQVNYVESSDPLEDLTGGRVAGVRALREQVGADLVSIVVRDCCGWCGIGWLYNANSAYGYSAVQASCIGGRTLAHELGHNQGCAHDIGDKGGLDSTAVGWRRCDRGSNNFNTIMSYGCSSGRRTIAVFSNPNVWLNSVGAAAGASNARCAAAIGRTASQVAAYRSTSNNGGDGTGGGCSDRRSECVSWGVSNYCGAQWVYQNLSVRDHWCRKTCGRCCADLVDSQSWCRSYCDPRWHYQNMSVRNFWCRRTCGVCS